jgi:hypothetical protein
VQPRRQLGALFERKLFDGSLDFRKAHIGDLTIAQLLFQVPVIQSEFAFIMVDLIRRTLRKLSEKWMTHSVLGEEANNSK